MAYESTPDTGKDANTVATGATGQAGTTAPADDAVKPEDAAVADQNQQAGEANNPTEGGAEQQKPADAKEEGNKDGTLLSDDGGDGSGGEDDGKSAGEGEQPKAEDYTYEPSEDFQISEEVQTKIDGFKETAAELGLSQEQFQKLVDFDIGRGQQAMESMAEAYQSRIQEWGEQVKADKELGGEKLNENLSYAREALKAFGSEKLQQMVGAPSEQNPEGLGLGNHPEFLRLMNRVGKALAEDKIIQGDGSTPAPSEEDSLRRIYPSMYKDAS